jgi:hypothetical protein
MQKSDKSKRSPFFKKKPQSLYKFIKSVSDKVFEAHPFSLLTSKKNKYYTEWIVKECGVSEKAISKIIIDSFEPDSLTIELIGKHHEVSEQGEAVFKGYTKVIEALEKVASQEVIADDKSYSGTRIGKTNIGLREAIMDDVKDLKKKRAAWASLFIVHPELKAEPIPSTARRMIENQAFCLFQYIHKCFRDTGKRIMAKDIYAFISELFKAIYDHPLFNAHVKFTPPKIKEYCDNGKRDRRMKKSSLRKSLV